jgi:hypothetical protein
MFFHHDLNLLFITSDVICFYNSMMSTMQGNVLLKVLSVNELYYISIFNINDTMSQVELNKAIIQRYFEAYNSKNEAIFDDIISPDYDSLDKFDVSIIPLKHIKSRL